MKLLAFSLVLAGLGSAAVRADLVAQDPFDYAPGDLSGNAGGSGWNTEWTDSGNAVVLHTPGLAYSDPVGNTLTVSGSAVDAADGSGTTTLSAREVPYRNADTWISLLVQPQNSATDFFGVSFYEKDLTIGNARFAIEHANGKDLRLTRRAGPQVNSPAFPTTLGQTVFAVLHLIPGGGDAEFPDRVEVFFNPALDAEPVDAHAAVNIDGLQFDRVRVAAANGRAAVVDELRIGETWADVAPYTPAVDPDHDGDGLTDSQEALLGLDPATADTAFIAALKANPGFLGLHAADEIEDVTLGATELVPASGAGLAYRFRLSAADGSVITAPEIPVSPPPGRQFFRLQLPTP